MGTQEKSHLGLLKIDHQAREDNISCPCKMWFRKPQSVSCFEKSHSANKMSSLVADRINYWVSSMESTGIAKEEVISQAHRFPLDLACCKTNLQLGITENPQMGELLSKCLNYSCEWWKAVGLGTGISVFEPSVFHFLVLMDWSKSQNLSFRFILIK